MRIPSFHDVLMSAFGKLSLQVSLVSNQSLCGASGSRLDEEFQALSIRLFRKSAETAKLCLLRVRLCAVDGPPMLNSVLLPTPVTSACVAHAQHGDFFSDETQYDRRANSKVTERNGSFVMFGDFEL